ncbi:MAG: hypothetical protein KDA57_09900 [Planctomycetales bacterium]|nr:hypothetical protein [Planctomycetales bacterium]
MAREIHEREDLLRDAKALTTRVQLEVDSVSKAVNVFAGFRSSGALSLYFDSEPAYHFNTQNQLRRAYVEDRLIKAEVGQLIALRRRQREDLSELLRYELSEAEQDQFCHALATRLDELRCVLQAGRYRIVGQVPADEDVAGRLLDWLIRVGEVIVANSANVG